MTIRVLQFTPPGVCYHCLNLRHDLCDVESCVCRNRKHDDSEWWISLKEKGVNDDGENDLEVPS